MTFCIFALQICKRRDSTKTILRKILHTQTAIQTSPPQKSYAMAWKKLFPREEKIQGSKHRNGNELKIIYIFGAAKTSIK